MGAKKGGEVTLSLAILPLPLARQEPRPASPYGHGANGSKPFGLTGPRGVRGGIALSQLRGILFFNVLHMTLHDTPFREIAALNDQARTSFRGCTLMLTKGIFDLPQAVQYEILQRVRNFNTFTPDNDPYGEHDFGAFDF